MSSTHAYFAFYRHVGLFNQWKGVKIVCFHVGAFMSKKTNCQTVRFARKRFFLLQFKVFFLSGSTRSIPNVGKWCFSQFKFRFACVASPFCVSEQVGSVTFDHALMLVRLILKRQVVFVSICIKISTFCLQILIRCCQKQTVWHWRARHLPKVYTISNKSNFNLEFPFRSCSMKILHSCCISVRGIILL